MFANLQLRTVQATDARDEYTFHHYVGLRLITTALGLAVIAGITFAAGYAAEKALVILLIGFGKCFDAVADIFLGLFQKREQMDLPALALGGYGRALDLGRGAGNADDRERRVGGGGLGCGLSCDNALRSPRSDHAAFRADTGCPALPANQLSE